MACERWCVTVCERWCVKMVCDEVPRCQPSARSATPATQMEGQRHQVPRLPRTWKVNVTKCHACYANGRSKSPSATPATQWKVNVTKRHACHTNGKGQCHQGPRLPRKWKVNVTKCHAGRAKWRPGRPSALKRAQARHQSQPSTTTPRLPRKWKVNVTKDGV